MRAGRQTNRDVSRSPGKIGYYCAGCGDTGEDFVGTVSGGAVQFQDARLLALREAIWRSI